MQAAEEETPKEVIAAQLKHQGYACDRPASATRNKERSKPDSAVWALKCESATYRVRLVPDMKADVEKFTTRADAGVHTANPGEGEGRMRFTPLLVGVVAITSLTGFGTTPKTFNQGYSDGYTVGYNTTCQVRGTYLDGDWDSTPYRKGYRNGLRAGVRACRHGGRPPEYPRRRWR